MKKVIILAVLALLGQSAWGQIRDFQTTRLLSTSGAGAASILSTEAAILNPASAAFFSSSSFSYQSYSASLRDKNDQARTSAEDSFPRSNKSQGVFLSDHTGTLKGGLAYLDQDENNFERKTIVMHGAALVSNNISLGTSYNYIEDTRPKKFSNRYKSRHQLTLGSTYIIDEKTVLALVFVDPTRANSGQERIIAGFQYSFADRLTLIGDVGARHTKNVTRENFWKAALQINIFSDFFLRAGKFYDKIAMFEGSSWGVSWMGPRLGAEFAQKFSEQMSKGTYLYRGESLVDTAFSLIIKF